MINRSIKYAFLIAKMKTRDIMSLLLMNLKFFFIVMLFSPIHAKTDLPDENSEGIISEKYMMDVLDEFIKCPMDPESSKDMLKYFSISNFIFYDIHDNKEMTNFLEANVNTKNDDMIYTTDDLSTLNLLSEYLIFLLELKKNKVIVFNIKDTKFDIKNTSNSLVIFKTLKFLLDFKEEGVLVNRQLRKYDGSEKNLYYGTYQEGNLLIDCIIKSPCTNSEFDFYTQNNFSNIPTLYKLFNGKYISKSRNQLCGRNTVVLEYIKGKTYTQRWFELISEFSSWDKMNNIDEIIKMTLTVGKILDSLHKQNFSHGSVHGQNMILRDDIWYLLDFEKCKKLTPQLKEKDWLDFGKYVLKNNFEVIIYNIEYGMGLKKIHHDLFILNKADITEPYIILGDKSSGYDNKALLSGIAEKNPPKVEFDPPIIYSLDDLSNYLKTVREWLIAIRDNTLLEKRSQLLKYLGKSKN